jgi:drug/metabolite transporter (DMT)-like permease
MTTLNMDEKEPILHEEYAQESIRTPSVATKLLLALSIGASWAIAAEFTGKAEVNFQKPLFLTLLHTVVLGVFSVCLLLLPGMRQHTFMWNRLVITRVFGLAILDLIANVSFTAALSLTNAPSALSLEQMTGAYICILSWLLLSERFPWAKIAGFVVSVGGNVLVVWADASSTRTGSQPLLGDVLVITAVAGCAAIYMVLLKMWFQAFKLSDLMAFFRLKSLILISLGIPILVVANYTHWEPFTLPEATSYLDISIGTLFGLGFGVSLAWSTIEVSPLSARLSILIGLPIAFLIDLAVGGAFVLIRLVGILVVISGLILFEYSSSTSTTAPTQKVVQNIHQLVGETDSSHRLLNTERS